MSKKKDRYDAMLEQFETDVSTLSTEIRNRLHSKRIFEKNYYNNAEMLIQYVEFLKVLDDICEEYIPDDLKVYENNHLNTQELWEKFNEKKLYIDTTLEFENREANYIANDDFKIKAKETIEAYYIFENNYNKAIKYMNILKTGAQGEENLYNRLKIIGDKISIIRNARYTMEDGFEVEHDMIIISPVGIFTVEIKNWKRDSYIDEKGYLISKSGNKANVVEQAMRHKHHLKRTLEAKLGTSFDIHPIIAWVNPDSVIKNEFEEIAVCNCNNIEFEILNEKKYSDSFSKEEREAIYRILDSLRIENSMYPINIDKDKTVDALSYMIVGIRALPKVYTFQLNETGKDIFKMLGGLIVTVAAGLYALASFLDNDK